MSLEIIISIASSVIALCALIFSIWQGIESRKHNRVSYRPHLTTWNTSDFEKGIFSLDLINNGLGSALIKSFVIKIDGIEIAGEGTDAIDKAIKTLFSDNLNYHAYYEHLGDSYAMGAKEKCRILSIEFNSEKLPSKEFFKESFNRADLEIKYESFYGEKFFFNTMEKKL